MAIKFPDLVRTHCVSVVACGFIKSPNRALAHRFKKEQVMIASLKTHNAKAFLRVWIGGQKSRHFHLEVVRASVFNPPKNKKLNTIEQINKTLIRFIGSEVEADLKGMFEIKLSELPEGGIIRSLLFQTQTGNVAIKVEGARLSITGAPVDSITWQSFKSGEKMRVMLEAEDVKKTISEDYLSDILSMLETSLNVFILGKVANEPK